MNYDKEIFAGFVLVLFGLVVPVALAWIIPAAKARARRIEREGMQSDPDVVAEVDHLRARLDEVEGRLDFAERMLARAAPGEVAALPPPERR